jgi:hypothetical protein
MVDGYGERDNMAIYTTTEKLEAVQSAIMACLTSQELSTEAGSVMRARLDFLVAYEQKLLAQYDMDAAVGGFQNKVKFVRPI